MKRKLRVKLRGIPLSTTTTPTSTPSARAYDWKRTVRGLAVLVALYLFVVYVISRPASVKPEGWRVAAIFFSTILGLIIQPIPGGAVVLLGVTLAAGTGGLSIDQA